MRFQVHLRVPFLAALALLPPGGPAAAQDVASATTARLQNCIVVMAGQADLAVNLPAQEVGVIHDIPVKEGDKVEKGQLLVQLDDRRPLKELEVAKAKYAAALVKAQDDINIRYAVAAAAVAKAEYDLNLTANKEVPGSVPKVRLSELFLKCRETELAIEKSKLDRTVATEEAKVANAEVGAAEVALDQHKILSPLDGVVVLIHSHKGEAVQPSAPVIRVVSLDTMWVEAGQVSASRYARSELEGQHVDVAVTITRDVRKTLPGTVIFVSPMTESGNTFLVRAKVDNVRLSKDSWLLYPGMQAEMNIQVKPSNP